MMIVTLLMMLFCKLIVFASQSKLDDIKKNQVMPLTKTAYYRTWELDKKGVIVKNSLKSSKPAVLKVTSVVERRIVSGTGDELFSGDYCYKTTHFWRNDMKHTA